MGTFIADGASQLPPTKSDARTPTGAATEWASGDANKVREALLDVRTATISESAARSAGDAASAALVSAETAARQAADALIIASGNEPANVGIAPVIATGQADARTVSDWMKRLDDGRSITPEDFGAIGDGTSHPLSERYATLGAAQVVYPHAVALTDEIDWCAWQAAADYLYTVGNAGVVSSYNFAFGKVTATGHYVVNRTITFNLYGVVIEGDQFPMTGDVRPGVKGTTIRYNGNPGTLDEPVFIIDSYIYDEFGNAPPGRKPGYPYQGMGNRATVRGVRVFGLAATSGVAGDESGYVSGLRLRTSSFSLVEGCLFGGNLWDAVVTTAPQLFLTIRNNWFSDIYRDAIGIRGTNNNFSTTIWIYENEFSHPIGRYAIACDTSYSIEPMPVVRNNSFEHIAPNSSSYFQQNPEWYVHGVVASCVFITSGKLVWADNRSENGNSLERRWGDLHLVSLSHGVIRDSAFAGIIFTGVGNAADKVQALIDYRAAYGYYDFTDVRAWIPATTGDALTSKKTNNVTIQNCLNLRTIILGGKESILSSGDGLVRIVNCGTVSLRRVDIIDGTYTKVLTDRLTAIQWLYDAPVSLESVSSHIIWYKGVGQDIHYDYRAATYSGQRIIRRANSFFSAWAANTAYVTTSLTGEKNEVIPVLANENGFVYKCTVAGTSDAAEPTWPTTLGATVVDGGVTWTCQGRDFGNSNYVPADGQPTEVTSGLRTIRKNAVPTAFMAGPWLDGERVLHTAPAEAGTTPNKYVITGWICVAPGSDASPLGTWVEMRSLTGN